MTRKHPFRFLLITALVIIIDQATKIAARHFLTLHEPVQVIGDFFCLTLVQNHGAAFSMSLGSDVFNRIFFSSITFVMIFVILWMLKRSKHVLEQLSFSMIVGGAVGNLIDRLFVGSVTDFLDFDFFDFTGLERWPVFNIADSSIVVAVVILLYYTFFLEHKFRKQESE